MRKKKKKKPVKLKPHVYKVGDKVMLNDVYFKNIHFSERAELEKRLGVLTITRIYQPEDDYEKPEEVITLSGLKEAIFWWYLTPYKVKHRSLPLEVEYETNDEYVSTEQKNAAETVLAQSNDALAERLKTLRWRLDKVYAYVTEIRPYRKGWNIKKGKK